MLSHIAGDFLLRLKITTNEECLLFAVTLLDEMISRQ